MMKFISFSFNEFFSFLNVISYTHTQTSHIWPLTVCYVFMFVIFITIRFVMCFQNVVMEFKKEKEKGKFPFLGKIQHLKTKTHTYKQRESVCVRERKWQIKDWQMMIWSSCPNLFRIIIEKKNENERIHDDYTELYINWLIWSFLPSIQSDFDFIAWFSCFRSNFCQKFSKEKI